MTVTTVRSGRSFVLAIRIEMNNRKPESSWRLYYINATTGLIDKIVSEIGGERTEANLTGWTTSGGETLPSQINWSRNGQMIMEFRLTNFILSDAR